MDNLSKGDKIYYPEMDIARGIAILLVFLHTVYNVVMAQNIMKI